MVLDSLTDFHQNPQSRRASGSTFSPDNTTISSEAGLNRVSKWENLCRISWLVYRYKYWQKISERIALSRHKSEEVACIALDGSIAEHAVAIEFQRARGVTGKLYINSEQYRRSIRAGEKPPRESAIKRVLHETRLRTTHYWSREQYREQKDWIGFRRNGKRYVANQSQ